MVLFCLAVLPLRPGRQSILDLWLDLLFDMAPDRDYQWRLTARWPSPLIVGL